MDNINYEEDVTPILPDSTALAKLSALANAQLFLEQQIEEKEEHVKELKKGLQAVSGTKIPELMNEIGMSKFSLSNGSEVKVTKVYAGTLGKDNKEEAFEWLRDNGFGSLIKTEASVEVPSSVNMEAFMVDLSALLTIHSIENDINISQGVHHNTLSAFIKEQVESGKAFPLTTFKAFIGNKTKITIK